MLNSKKVLLISILPIISVALGCSMGSTEKKSSPLSDQKTNMSSSESKTIVATWDSVAVDYVGKLEDGTLFDTSIETAAKEWGTYMTWRNYAPLKFKVWAWMMIKWFDQWVIWMKVWETKTLTLTPDLAYWEYKKENIHDIPLDVFKKASLDPVIGQEIVVWWWMTWKILEVKWDQVSVDFNHRLAWKTLIFEVTLKDIK